MRVLVADDSPSNRQILYDLLSTAGYEVITVANGNHAVQQALEQRPDLAILDVDMPGKDGFAVCAELKQDPIASQMPIIILTAYSDVDSRVRGLGLGAEDFVSKPFSPRELLARVDARLRTKAETDEIRKERAELRQTFERFVARDIVEALMQNPQAAQLGGALREITILFADMEGFTSLSERTDPVTLLSILNNYHSLVVERIKSNGGTVDKFLGDGVMAIYNAPVEHPDHALRAVKTAYEIQNALANFHETLPSQFRLNINFGINTGNAVVGNVGTVDVMDYTAIGDAVNLAQRLQDISTGGVITIGEATYHYVKHYAEIIACGARQLRGREEPVQIYQVQWLLE
ncbi:MAG: response regulator [Anaerolineales bacterium]|nr:response regulator [Anaerolineales bacterium]